MTTTRPEALTSQAAIFARIWEGGNGSLPIPVARHVLKVGFSDADKARMRGLLDRNEVGELNREELEELDNFVKVGDMLALLQSKARKLLKRAAGHG